MVKTPENVPDNNVGRKTPEEIKEGLMCYRGKHPFAIGHCPSGCPYEQYGTSCRDMMNTDALTYIQQLESRLAQAERERDALKHDMRQCQSAVCNACKHHYRPNPDVRFYECALLGRFSDFLNSDDDRPFICGKFEWRGVCPENTKEDEYG